MRPMKRPKRLIFIIGMLCSAAVFCGFTFGFAKVSLKSTAPLINLGEMIKDSRPGNGGKTETGLSDPGKLSEKETEEKKETEAETSEIKAPEETVTVTITVTVSDTEIFLDGKKVHSPEELSRKISGVWKDGMNVLLVDDYAEYAAYRSVKDALDELGIHPEETGK